MPCKNIESLHAKLRTPSKAKHYLVPDQATLKTFSKAKRYLVPAYTKLKTPSKANFTLFQTQKMTGQKACVRVPQYRPQTVRISEKFCLILA